MRDPARPPLLPLYLFPGLVLIIGGIAVGTYAASVLVGAPLYVAGAWLIALWYSGRN